jgi:hypothetical protein
MVTMATRVVGLQSTDGSVSVGALTDDGAEIAVIAGLDESGAGRPRCWLPSPPDRRSGWAM